LILFDNGFDAPSSYLLGSAGLCGRGTCDHGTAASWRRHQESPVTTVWIIVRNISVNPNGQANFDTVQSAIDAVPANNPGWIRIHVASGVYREKVTIPMNKTFIMLEGDGRENTSIEWDDYNSTDHSHHRNVHVDATATFDCSADNFIARSISFKGVRPAVAAQVSGDRVSFYNCGFISVQDVCIVMRMKNRHLSDLQGRHLYQNCYIEGGIDFIFGHARSIFQLPAGIAPGFITAHGRWEAEQHDEFVFTECTVDGVTPVYLGRAWRDFARVIFYRTSMSSIVVRRGWSAWHSVGHERNLTMLECECTGQGSNRTGRAPWSRAVSATQIARFTSLSYISADGWIEAQPH
ncbi:hypothetical protein BRADI_2g03212v3, partial [Brachypodium distachyon]